MQAVHLIWNGSICADVFQVCIHTFLLLGYDFALSLSCESKHHIGMRKVSQYLRTEAHGWMQPPLTSTEWLQWLCASSALDM